MLPFSEACERNKQPILDVLRDCLPAPAQTLEIGSGTGQHAVYFAANLLHLTWHPTERLEQLPALTARIRAEGGANIRAPTVLDVSQPIWPLRRAGAVFTANTLHIMSWPQVIDMLRGVGRVLEPRGVLCVYGPFRYAGDYTSDSNRHFDRTLRERNHISGIRDIEAVSSIAGEFGMTLELDRDLPAFNRLLVYRKEPTFNR